jgi:ATP-dependent Zn protease
MAQTALDEAVALLQPRRPLMDALVNLLIEQETIEGDCFRDQVDHYERDAQLRLSGSIMVSTRIAPLAPNC